MGLFDTLGSIAGFAFGGPLGSAAGSALGGLLGGGSGGGGDAGGLGSALSAPAIRTSRILGTQSPAITRQGLTNLLQLLQGQGQTSPLLFNRQIDTANRQTEGNVASIESELARRGLTNAIPGLALTAATREAGANRVSDIRAREVTTAEERKRQDLQSLFQLLGLINQQAAVGSGNVQFQQAQNTNQDAAIYGLLGTLISAFA